MFAVGIALLGVGLLVALIGLFHRMKAAKIMSAPLAKTGQIAANQQVAGPDGTVSCEGNARAQQPLVAPCSNTPCVYYRIKIEKKVKETRGNQTSTSWKLASDLRQGVFYVDDGSGGVWLQPEGIDADLTKTYSGAPPAQLAASLPPLSASILEYRATEEIIANDAKVFVMGKVTNAQIVKPLVSTRGRSALVASKQKLGMIMLAAGAVGVLAGPAVMIFKPGQVALCAALTNDPAKECRIETAVVEKDRKQADGSMKKETFREKVLTWEVTKTSKFALELRSNSSSTKDRSYPVLQVESSIGFPVNIGINMGFSSDSAKIFKTKTATLQPGTYTIYAWAQKDGSNDYLLAVKDLGVETASK